LGWITHKKKNQNIQKAKSSRQRRATIWRNQNEWERKLTFLSRGLRVRAAAVGGVASGFSFVFYFSRSILILFIYISNSRESSTC
jgi:hypothetical protein